MNLEIPDRKVGSGFLAGAAVTIIVWLVEAFTDVDVPPEVAAALVTIISFAAGYYVAEPKTQIPPSPPESARLATPAELADLPRADLAEPVAPPPTDEPPL